MACDALACGGDGLCGEHLRHWRRAGRPAGAAFDAWRERVGEPLPGSRHVDLGVLSETLRWEFLLGLSVASDGHRRTRVSELRRVVSLIGQREVASSTELDASGLRTDGVRLFVSWAQDRLRLAFADPDREWDRRRAACRARARRGPEGRQRRRRRREPPDVGVASPWHPFFGERIRVEHWANALNQGRAAARAMLGEPISYDHIAYFFSDQYDVGMEYSGHAPQWDEVAFRGDPASGEFIAFWLRDGRVAAGMNVNVWDVNEHIQALIRSRRVIDVAALSDPDTPLESLAGEPTTGS